MAIKIIESAKNLTERIRTDVQRNWTGSNPFLKNGLVSAITIAFGNRFYDTYRLINYWKNQFFVDTADVENLEIFANLKDVTQDTSSPSQGPIVMEGTAGTIVDAGEVWTFGDFEYETLSTVTILASSQNVTSLTQISGTATATFNSDHFLATGATVTISGANESDYNGTFVISVISATEFTYSINPTAPGVATGTISSANTSAYVEVRCTSNGSDTNVSSSATMDIQVNNPNIDSVAFVAFGGVQGGTDEQTTEEYREEILEAWRNPVTQFNDAAITKECKKVAGVTRVFVKRITPAVGQVTVYFTRDNDTNIIPSASEVTSVKNQLDTIVPMNTALSDVFVLSLTAVPVNFQFASITPNTNSMRTAIKESLDAFFRTSTSEGTDLTEEQYIAAIKNTFDSATGQKLEAFTLTTPSGDVTVNAGEIATLGTVVYS